MNHDEFMDMLRMFAMVAIFLLFGILLAALTGCASPQWEQVVANRYARGTAVDGQCDVYARDLQSKLTFPTQRITWTAACNATWPATARHTVLAYQVGNESWFIDNLDFTPKWVGDVRDPIEDRIRQFYAPAFVHISGIKIE